MAGVLRKVLEALREGPLLVDSNQSLCNSPHAVRQIIYRLRKNGFVIETEMDGWRKTCKTTYTLKAEPDE